jgi:hypothetical protein
MRSRGSFLNATESGGGYFGAAPTVTGGGAATYAGSYLPTRAGVYTTNVQAFTGGGGVGCFLPCGRFRSLN